MEASMTEKPNNVPLPLARRLLLRSAVEFAGTAFLLGAIADTAIASPKLSQQAVAYQTHPAGDKRCDRCVQFQPPNACKIVDGTINPEGYCKFFIPRSQA
jgi:hypothetical protein